MYKTRKTPNGWLIAAIFIGAWLRFSHLGARGLWFDEGISLTYSQMSLVDIFHFHILWQDTNPPAYRILLGLWTAFTGPTPFAGRAFGGFLGLLALPLTYRLARLLRFRRWPAILASFVVAISPMQVFYSRELKHYPFVQFFVLLVICGWLRLFESSTRAERRPGQAGQSLAGLVIIISISCLLAVGAHYMAGILLLILDLIALVVFVQRYRTKKFPSIEAGRLGVWIGAQAMAALIILPWFVISAAGAVTGAFTTGEGQGSVTLPPVEFLTNQFVTFAAGPTGLSWLRFVLMGVILGTAIVGLMDRHLSSRTRVFVTSVILGSVLIGLIIQTRIPFFPPRFLLYVTPMLALFVGQGIVKLGAMGRGIPWASIILNAFPLSLIVLLSGLLLRSQRLDPQPAPDLRPLAWELRQSVLDGDALIYSYSWQPGMVAAYLAPGRQPTYYASFFPVGSLGSSLDEILRRHDRIWLLTYEIGADNPINDVGLWLLSHAATPGGSWFGESQLTLFLDPALEPPSAESASCVDTSDQRLTLCYHSIRGSGNPGEPFVLTLQWQVRSGIQERYVVFLHLVGPDSPIPAAQQDSEPVNGQSPTYSWQVGETINDPHAVVLPNSPQSVDSTYQIYAGLYDADTLARVPWPGGVDAVNLGTVTVHAP